MYARLTSCNIAVSIQINWVMYTYFLIQRDKQDVILPVQIHAHAYVKFNTIQEIYCSVIRCTVHDIIRHQILSLIIPSDANKPKYSNAWQLSRLFEYSFNTRKSQIFTLGNDETLSFVKMTYFHWVTMSYFSHNVRFTKITFSSCISLHLYH